MNMHEVGSIVKPHASGMSATVSMERLRVKYNIVNVLHKLYSFILATAHFRLTA